MCTDLYIFAKHPALVQRLCTVYMQDYLCLGFQLPVECEGGRELLWASASNTVPRRKADRNADGAKQHHGFRERMNEAYLALQRHG